MSKKAIVPEDTVDVTQEFDVDYSPSDKLAFAHYIKARMKEYNEEHGTELSVRSLAESLDIGFGMFQKKLNQEKPVKQRDCLIAICVLVHLSRGETDYALNLYDYTPALDDQNPRDKFIADQINLGTTVSALNQSLISHGFPGLEIQNKRDGKQKQHQAAKSAPSNYKAIRKAIRTPISRDYYYGDPYNSLCTTYDPFNCVSSGYIILKDLKTEKYIELNADSTGQMYSRESSQLLPKTYKTLEDTGDYKSFFTELKNALDVEKRRLLDVLNDTRNYQVRASARLIGNSICVFSEEFNYTIPELNEYYVVCLSKGKYRMSVYRQSAFMWLYLPEKSYQTYYSIEKPKAIVSYDSIQQLDEILQKENKTSSIAIKCRMRRKAFERLQKNVNTLYENLRSGKEFIQNLDYIYDNPLEVLPYYGLEKDFECKYDKEYTNEIIDALPSKDYALPDGTTITITEKDVEKAFELGYESIEQICQLKAELGSVDAVL